MTSTFIFTKNNLRARLRALDPAWKLALGAFLVARGWLLVWPFVISLILPVAVQNLDLFGAPVLAAFDLASSERYVYSRQLDGTTLTFRAGERGYITDAQTGSVWSLREGRAQGGPYLGRRLETSAYTAEEIFPYHGVFPETNPLLTLWQRFDTNSYLKIAERGYSADDGSIVYFPLYPLLIHIAGGLLWGHNLLAAMVVSNLALVGALYFLFRIATELIGASCARRTLVYLVMFPTAFFLLAAYTESLFLCLSLAALFAGQRQRWLWAGVLGALAALTRLQGVVLLLPLAYMWWKQFASDRLQVAGCRLDVSRFTHDALGGVALLLIPLANLAFLAATNLSLLTSYEGQLHARFVLPWDNFFASIALIAQGRVAIADLLNLAVTIVFTAMSVVVWARLPREYGLYAVGMLLAPMLRMTTQQPLVSMTRYVLAVFPVFVVWAAWGKNGWVNRGIIYTSLPLNLYLSAQFFMWGWVA